MTLLFHNSHLTDSFDWDAYMEQVARLQPDLPQRPQWELRYDWLVGDTGPLVYPAAHVYIHTALAKISGWQPSLWTTEYIPKAIPGYEGRDVRPHSLIRKLQFGYMVVHLLTFVALWFIYADAWQVRDSFAVRCQLSGAIHTFVFPLPPVTRCHCESSFASCNSMSSQDVLALQRGTDAAPRAGSQIKSAGIARRERFGACCAVARRGVGAERRESWIPLLCLVSTAVLLSASRRARSVAVLGLFNDAWAGAFTYTSLALALRRQWSAASVLYSVAVAVKMNGLLYAPGFAFVWWQAGGVALVVQQVAICAAVQLALGAPFLIAAPVAYVTAAFNLGRVFNQHWSVNWRWLPPAIFSSKLFAVALLLSHVAMLAIAARWLWSGSWSRHQQSLSAQRREVSVVGTPTANSRVITTKPHIDISAAVRASAPVGGGLSSMYETGSSHGIPSPPNEPAVTSVSVSSDVKPPTVGLPSQRSSFPLSSLPAAPRMKAAEPGVRRYDVGGDETQRDASLATPLRGGWMAGPVLSGMSLLRLRRVTAPLGGDADSSSSSSRSDDHEAVSPRTTNISYCSSSDCDEFDASAPVSRHNDSLAGQSGLLPNIDGVQLASTAAAAYVSRTPRLTALTQPGPAHIAYVLMTSNFIGISVARSLHFQFHVWYWFALPCLLLLAPALRLLMASERSTRGSGDTSYDNAAPQSWLLVFAGAFVLAICLEVGWSVHPPTTISSGLVTAVHAAVLAVLLSSRLPEAAWKTRTRSGREATQWLGRP